MADPNPAEGLQPDTRQPATRKYGIDNANGCSYNENSRCGQTGETDMDNEMKEALDFAHQFTTQQKIQLIELLEALLQSQAGDPNLAESAS